jgi:hypothetical protein
MANWDDIYELTDDRLRRRLPNWQSIFDTMHQPLPDAVTLEVSPDRILNAWVSFRPGHGRHSVGISILARVYLRRMCVLAARHFPFPESFDDSFTDLTEIAEQFASLILEVGGFKDVSPDLELPKGGERSDLAAMLDDLTLDFIVAHELAHVALNHLSSPQDPTRRIDDDSDADALTWGQVEEAQADWHGAMAHLAMADRDGIRLALALWAIDYTLACLGLWQELEERLLWPIAGQLNEIARRSGKGLDLAVPRFELSHPPAKARRLVIWEGLERVLGDRHPQNEFGIAKRMASRNDNFLTAVWRSAREPFAQGMFAQLQLRRPA